MTDGAHLYNLAAGDPYKPFTNDFMKNHIPIHFPDSVDSEYKPEKRVKCLQKLLHVLFGIVVILMSRDKFWAE